MEKTFSKKNGYYKYYNKEGLSCRIKISENIKSLTNFEATVVYFEQPGVRNMHKPNKIFKDVFDVINFITKNLEHNKLVFEVTA